jgi:predicted alpha/beta superfamily hydrolase
MYLRWFILLLSMLVSTESTSGQIAYPPVTVPGTELRLMHSDILGQDLELCIRLPWTYNSLRDSMYSVLYCLDANRAFPMIANIATVQETPGFGAQEKIIVGVGYRTTLLADWSAWRTRDLTPTRDREVEQYWQKMLSQMTGKPYAVISGGASRFLDCIQKDVIPFVEQNYRATRTNRGLSGYSYGGLFALYALFHAPGTFTRIFAGSPSLDWDDGTIFHDEEAYAASHADLAVRLFMTVGALEDSTTKKVMETMAGRLRTRGYKSLRMRTAVFEDETHASCMAAAISRALQVLYQPQAAE